jgi:hypothetical protein
MRLGKTLEERMRIMIEDYARVKTLVTADTKLGTKDIPMKNNLLHTALMAHQDHTRQSTRESLQPLELGGCEDGDTGWKCQASWSYSRLLKPIYIPNSRQRSRSRSFQS